MHFLIFSLSFTVILAWLWIGVRVMLVQFSIWSWWLTIFNMAFTVSAKQQFITISSFTPTIRTGSWSFSMSQTLGNLIESKGCRGWGAYWRKIHYFFVLDLYTYIKHEASNYFQCVMTQYLKVHWNSHSNEQLWQSNSVRPMPPNQMALRH
jgi:hypothetical protein